jgi:CRISPR/Cas system-associated endoribonuclease Cas2
VIPTFLKFSDLKANYLGDFDRSGQDAARSLEEKLTRFADGEGIEVIFETIAVTLDQIRTLGLSTRPPKRESAADKNWPHDFACELDAMEPDELRRLVESAINDHIDQDQLRILKIAEEDERRQLRMFCSNF